MGHKMMSLMLLLVSIAPLVMGSEKTTIGVCNSCLKFTSLMTKVNESSENPSIRQQLKSWCTRDIELFNENHCNSFIENLLSLKLSCTGLGACLPTEFDQPVIRSENPVQGNGTCTFCLDIATQLKDFVTSPDSETELKTSLLSACKSLGKLEEECVTIVNQNLDQLFVFLRQVMDPKTVCESMGVCYFTPMPTTIVFEDDILIDVDPITTTTVSSAINESGVEREMELGTESESENEMIIPPSEVNVSFTQNPSSPMDCLVCQHAAKWIIKKVTDNKTQEEIEQYLDKVCEEAFSNSSSKRNTCETFVKEYTEELVSLILQEEDPKEICAYLGICSHKKPTIEGITTPSNCNMCKNLIPLVPRMKSVEDLPLFCSPFSRPSDCLDHTSSNYGFIKFLTRKADFNKRTVCSKVHFCPLEEEEVTPVPSTDADGDIESVSTVPITSLPTCILCKRVVKYLDQVLKDNRTEPAIESALTEVCSILKDIDNCDSKVHEWSVALTNALQQAADPEIVCMIAMLCSSPPSPPAAVVVPTMTTTPAPPKVDICFECQQIAHFIQTKMFDYKTEEAIERYLDANVCAKLQNDAARETCISFVNEYGPAIMQLIAQKEFDPKKLCSSDLHVCPASSSSPSSNPNVLTPTNQIEFEMLQPEKEDMCNTCVNAVTVLDQLLAEGPIDQGLAHIASRVCRDIKELPKQRQCINMVETFGPFFLQMIGRVSNPRKVCKAIDLCILHNEPNFLGGNKCTYGPTYWCHTVAHADSCKARDYCQKSVWEAIEQKGPQSV